MKMKVFVAGIVCFAGIVLSRAATINIPDGAFQNANAAINPPFIGATSGNIGAWSAGYTNLAGIDAGMASSNAATAGWMTPPSGCTNELKITLPGSIAATAAISQALTNCLKPNSVYTLSVDLSPQTTLSILSGSTLNLYAVGSTNLASVGGTTLANLLTNSTSYQTVALTYKTPNTVPTNAIGVSFVAGGVANVGGSIFVDDFQLSVNPIQVQLSSAVTAGRHGQPGTVTLNGSGGVPGSKYEIITSTNLLIPSAVWTQVITNQFDTNGDFSQTFTVDPHMHYQFFRTVLP